MKNLILFTVCSCLSFSLIGQPAEIKHRNPIQYVKSHDNFGENEKIKMPNFDKLSSFITNRKEALSNVQLKNTNVKKQKLDSVLCSSPNSPNILFTNKYKYDEYGNLTNEEIFGPDNYGVISKRNIAYNYDTNGNLTKETILVWDYLNKIWGNYSISEKTYSNNRLNTLTNWYFSNYVVPQWWDTGNREEYKYNLSGNLIKTNYYYWEKENSTWILYSFSDYTSDEKGFINQVITYRVNGLIIENSVKIDYNYDTKGNITLKMVYHWNWIPDSKDWDVFVESRKIEYTYNNDGNIVRQKISNWPFERSYTFEHLVSINGNMINETYSCFDGEVYTDEEYNGKREFISDINYTKTDLIIPFNINDLILGDVFDEYESEYQSFPFNHKLVSELISTYGKDGILHDRLFQLYYSPFETTGITQNQNLNFSFYPNPADEVVTFNWTSKVNTLNLKLFQINGTLILDQVVTKGNPVSIKQFEKGIYTYKLSDGNKILYTGKLLLY